MRKKTKRISLKFDEHRFVFENERKKRGIFKILPTTLQNVEAIVKALIGYRNHLLESTRLRRLIQRFLPDAKLECGQAL